MTEFIALFIALIVAAITYGTPLLFGTLGEILTEKSGNLNLGVEGIMFMGGAIGLGSVFYYEKWVASPNPYLAVVIALLFGGAILTAGEKAGVPTQREVLPFGGTDAGSMQLTRSGVRVCTLSIPCRNVHSACEVIDLRDVEAGKQLLMEYLRG